MKNQLIYIRLKAFFNSISIFIVCILFFGCGASSSNTETKIEEKISDPVIKKTTLPKKSTTLSKNANTIPEKGSFTDKRDGKKYEWVILKDGKKWMSQNLDFIANESSCYNNDPENCKKYGRLYSWNASQNVCPKGWHLPTDDEWWNMASKYGKAYSAERKNKGNNAGKDASIALLPGGGSGFSMQLGGLRNTYLKSYEFIGEFSAYWIQKKPVKKGKPLAWCYFIDNTFTFKLTRHATTRGDLMSCRCIKD